METEDSGKRNSHPFAAPGKYNSLQAEIVSGCI